MLRNDMCLGNRLECVKNLAVNIHVNWKSKIERLSENEDKMCEEAHIYNTGTKLSSSKLSSSSIIEIY